MRKKFQIFLRNLPNSCLANPHCPCYFSRAFTGSRFVFLRTNQLRYCINIFLTASWFWTSTTNFPGCRRTGPFKSPADCLHGIYLPLLQGICTQNFLVTPSLLTKSFYPNFIIKRKLSHGLSSNGYCSVYDRFVSLLVPGASKSAAQARPA